MEKLRLTKFEIESIKNIKDEIFGKNAKIYLFGSRVDSNKKGGDIDLFVIADKGFYTLEKKIDFIRKLQDKIGDYPIDLIFQADKNRLIEKEALKGVKL